MSNHNRNDEDQKYSFLRLILELPRVIWHLGKAFWNYSRGRGFTDEP